MPLLGRLPFLLAVFLIAALFSEVSQANFSEEVSVAVYILSDYSSFLAFPFCTDYIATHEVKETITRTNRPVIITRTLPASICASTTAATENPTDVPQVEPTITVSPPDYSPTITAVYLSTVTRTTTITHHTTMTVTVYPSLVYPRHYQNHARSPQILRPYHRAQWCGVFELPCRLVQYTPDVLVEACFQYLRRPYNTITKTMRGQTETEMVPATTCHTILERVYPEEENYGLERQEEEQEDRGLETGDPVAGQIIDDSVEDPPW